MPQTASNNTLLADDATTPQIVAAINRMGGRSSDFPPSDSWVDSTAHQTYRSEFEFRKYAPKFNPSLDTFSRFHENFEGISKSFPCTTMGYKSILHQSLIGSAKGIALSFAPHKEPYAKMSKDEYVKTIRELFEPVDKIPALYQLYISRKQYPKETLVAYFQHKLELYNAVLPYKDCQTVNWIQFYEECINGLLNLRVRREIRSLMVQQKFQYENKHKHDEVFRNCLRAIETTMQAEYRNGEISEADMAGVPTQMTLSLVNPTVLDQTLIPHSSINAIDSRIRCWGCGQPGHRMVDCPKRQSSAGQSQVQSQVHEVAEPVGYDDDFEYYELEETDTEGEINAFRRRPYIRRFRVPRGRGRGRGSYRGHARPYRSRTTRGGYRSVSYMDSEGEKVSFDVPEGQIESLISSLQESQLTEDSPDLGALAAAPITPAPPTVDLTNSTHFLGEDLQIPKSKT